LHGRNKVGEKRTRTGRGKKDRKSTGTLTQVSPSKEKKKK